EMPLAPELLRRRGEQQQARRALRDGLDRVVFGAGGFEAPFEMVRLVHDQQIPGPGRDLGGALRMRGDPRSRAEDELVVEEGVGRLPRPGVRAPRPRLDGEGALLVVDGEGKREASVELDE